MKNVLKGKHWSPASTDRALLLVVLVCGFAAVALAAGNSNLSRVAALAALTSLTTGVAVWRWSGTLGARLVMATAMGLLTGLQVHAGGGNPAYQLSVHLCLALLLVYRDWRPIALLASLGALNLVALGSLLQSAGWVADPATPASLSPVPDLGLHLLFLLLHAATLCGLAVSQDQKTRAADELEFLVKAMGREGTVRLNLDVIRAETAIGQRLQQVQQRMADAIRAVHAAAQRVDIAAQRVATGSGELMTRTEATANGLRDAAMCLDQINVIVQHSTEASNEAKLMSDKAAGIADHGEQLVSNVVQTMEDIQSSSKRIADIIAVIDGIAFQTNILALNAAVEAARAGEQGRGFAVVASEVRSLASRSAAAAKEIKSLIGNSSSTVASGARQVAEAGSTMNDLVSSVRRVGALFDEVTADTSDHMQSLNMVSQSMTDLGTITQQNVSLAEKTDSAAAELQDLAAQLAGVLSAFNLAQSARPAGTLSLAAGPSATNRQPAQAAGGSQPAVQNQQGASNEVTFF